MQYQCYYECKLYRARAQLTEKISVQCKNRLCKKITFEVNKQCAGEALEEELRIRADREKQEKEEAKREMMKRKKERFCETRALIGAQITQCWPARMGRIQLYEKARNRVDKSMVSLFTLQKYYRREAAERGRKEGRKAKTQRVKRRKILKEAWERAVWDNFESGGVEQALKELQIGYLEGTRLRNWGREIRWLERHESEREAEYVWMVDHWNTNYEYKEEQRKDVTEIMIGCARKKKISWEIDVSIQKGVKHERGDGEAFTLGKKEQRGKERKVKRREEGSRRIITRGDGLVWVLPQEVLEENT